MVAQTLPRSDNPGLAPFDISAYKGVAGENYYEKDTMLRRAMDRFASGYDSAHRQDMASHLSGYGELCGGILNELVIAAHKEEKYGEIVKYDRAGNRIDDVRYCYEQNEVRRISYEYGIVNLDFHHDWKHPFTTLHRMALAYLGNINGEGGFTCPLAMTDGMIRALQALGTEEQKARYLPLVAGPESTSYFMCGQYVTERTGGSNVAQNRTIARQGENGKWYLTGEKWFCSNPGDLWVTTARIEDSSTIGMFLVPRIKEDGELNGCHLLRKKDIIGSRGKLTAEAVYENAEAEPLGRLAHGLANMIKYVIKTSRLHVSVAAGGMARRAFIEARAYTRVRQAYGKRVVDFPTVQRTLAEMHVLQSAMTWAIFRNYALEENGSRATGLLTPLLKYSSTVLSTWITHEAMMLHGGNGILGDFSVLPRLHNDSIINETWEGTHQIIGEHTLKAFSRPRIREAYFQLLDENVAKAVAPELEEALSVFRQLRDRLGGIRGAGDPWAELNRLYVCDSLYNAFMLSEFLREAASQDPDMVSFARGFAELAQRGIGGPTDPKGPFAEAQTLERLIDY